MGDWVNRFYYHENWIFIDSIGSFVSFSTQENVTALLYELNLETYSQYHTGTSLAELQRRVHKYSLPVPYVSLLSFLESIYSVFRVWRIQNVSFIRIKHRLGSF